MLPVLPHLNPIFLLANKFNVIKIKYLTSKMPQISFRTGTADWQTMHVLGQNSGKYAAHI